MKYISTIIFAVALAYSWNLIHREVPISAATHEELQQIWLDGLRERILQVKPEAQNIEMIDIRSEALNDTTVKLSFSYRFQEPDENNGPLITQTIKSEALLLKSKPKDPNSNEWDLSKLKIETVEMDFKDGVLITPVAVPGNEEPQKLVPVPDAPSQKVEEPLPSGPTTPVYE